MQDAVFSFISQFGYAAVGCLIFFENVFPPIPSELILPLAGFFSRTGDLCLPLAILAATIGSLTGAYVLYAIGTRLDEERLSRILSSRPARMFGFEETDVRAAFGWFETKGQKTVLICRCIPVVRSLISIPAGMSRMGLGRFSLMTFMGSLAWNTVLCGLGYWAGGAWQQAASGAASVIDIMSYAVIAVFGVAALVWFCRRILPRIKAQGTASQDPASER
jgi:membrane protein DedA with SNARE-associated domain